LGEVTEDKQEAAKLMKNLKTEDGLDIINKAIITTQTNTA
jgi:hypothetical protein